MADTSLRYLICALALLANACGYHVAGQTGALPATIQTIAVTPWLNGSTQYKLSDRLAQAMSRELITRTRYKIVADPSKADAVLSGSVANMFSNATISDPIGGRSTGGQVIIQIQVRLVEKGGKVLFNRPNLEYRERYEIGTDPRQYFDASEVALDRLSRDVSRSVVSAILESF